MALSLLAANNAQTVLAAGISSTATSLTVNAGTGTLFPSPVAGTSFFKLTIIDAATGSLTEIVHVTARAGDVFTIQRGQEGTVPRAWSANDIAANMMTAGTLSYILGNFQPLDPTLTALAALVGVANKLPYFNGDDTAALTDLTQVGRDIIGKSSIADILTYLGLGPNRIALHPDETTLISPGNKLALGVRDDGTWGGFDIENQISKPLSLEFGGTGSINAVDARANLGLKSAAIKDTGTGAGQIPDMSAWTSGGNATQGWRRSPDGYIEQWGISAQTITDVQVTFAIPFPEGAYRILERDIGQAGTTTTAVWQIYSITKSTFVANNLGVLSKGNPSLSAPSLTSVAWWAFGR